MRRFFITALTAVALLLSIAPGIEAASGHLEGYVPAVARADGLFDSSWSTDLWIYQQGATVIHLWFNPSGRDNTEGESVVLQFDDPVIQISDVVASLFETSGIGSLHYLADGPVTVISRTWTASPDGGSYGQTIPGIPIGSASYADTGQAGTLRMLLDQDAGSRANLGLVNISPEQITVLVEIFTADGNPAPGNNTRTVQLQPFDMKQLGDILSGLNAGERQGLIVRAGITSSSGGLMTYLSVVDNETNDPSYQEGFRFGF